MCKLLVSCAVCIVENGLCCMIMLVREWECKQHIVFISIRCTTFFCYLFQNQTRETSLKQRVKAILLQFHRNQSFLKQRDVLFRRLSVLPKLLQRRQVVNLFSLFYIIWLSQWIYTTNIKHLTPTSLSRNFEVKLYMKKRLRSFVLDKRAVCYGSLFAFGIIQIQIQIQSSSPGPFAERNFMYVWNLQV